jgi:ERCC4-type nuclease
VSLFSVKGEDEKWYYKTWPHNNIESLRDKKLIALIKKELKRAQELEDKIFNDIKVYVEQNQNLKEDYQRLSTIPGIGEKAAIALLTLFKTYQGTITGTDNCSYRTWSGKKRIWNLGKG